ncbi:HAD-IA family hydrolase [uncultured Reyranella sp.]|uniref:HAD-IA family hydrolase n=1 Tax=uncultured Reyranella sp. TaxID=735512 RepID=UPI0025F85463|nr:HAD-IA family hydrolase [uncultured Reyranella sp.]
MTTTFPKAVLFDLLTALLDSWTLWNDVAGSEERGRAWRAGYLRLTYGCGAYIPYEQLVREAAVATGLPGEAADALEARWLELPPWSGAQAALDALAGRTKLGVVTNCSIRLGRQAASRLKVHWDCVITAEEAGCYKPDPRPYRRALEALGVAPGEAAFVAGSGYDLFGTSAVGLRTYWHNRVGLARPDGAPPAALERSTLDDLLPWLEGRLS